MSNLGITSIRFKNFKALGDYSISLNEMNILVGPNNSGKSTIISSLRILDIALKRAKRLKAERVTLPSGGVGFGHNVPEHMINVSLENVSTDYNDEDSEIFFRLTNGNKLNLFFPHDGGCVLHWQANGATATTPTAFKKAFPIVLQLVPVLGPLEHEEKLVNQDTVLNGLNTHRASRHFRNYWFYFHEGWDEFKEMISQTWQDMEIQPPELIDARAAKLTMFASEKRIDREVYWAGFGFQVWCQLLTHLSRADSANLVVIDEPEIYLHPDVQRQLLGILRNKNADILLATHSVEIMGEADPTEILLINKTQNSARRLKDIDGIQQALESLGSAQNVTLTHLARTKRMVFVEGVNDYKIIRRFSQKMGFEQLSTGNDITPFESGGFTSWEKIKSFAWGLTKTIDEKISIGAVYDRDYFCEDEILEIKEKMEKDLSFAHFHSQKEIENYFLNVVVLDRLLVKQVENRNNRIEEAITIEKYIGALLEGVTQPLKSDIQGQYIAKKIDFYKGLKKDSATITSETIQEFEEIWSNIETRLSIVPGKKVLRALREEVKNLYQVNLTDFQIIDEFTDSEVPSDLVELIEKLESFRTSTA